ncbi:MAG: FprA family A-type flavoprotein [Azospirillum sp.]|nr:FprA family A-type flavoprotein [Azospirillum sp.]
MINNKLTETVYYVGVDDKDIDLFEGQYIVPNGISYNSYIITDKKIAVMDTVDARKTNEWLINIEKVLNGKKPDYLVILHMEPDHTGSLETFLNKYPDCKIVSNAKLFAMIPQFFEGLNIDDEHKVVVAEGGKLELGEHVLTFVMAPMVHWPEVMVAYDNKDKILFSADGFGKFGALDTDEDWACEARRYYINIVGKYGAPVQSLLKKASTLDIEKIFPLHGPMLTENLSYYINKYDIWSSYRAEDKGILIAYASVYGHTKFAAEKLAEELNNMNQKTILTDLARDDMAEAVEDAFRYDRLVLASVTYDGGLFPVMEQFISRLKSKNYQNRKVAFIENGSWAPLSAKLMKTEMEKLKNITIIEPVLTIKSSFKTENQETLKELARNLCE